MGFNVPFVMNGGKKSNIFNDNQLNIKFQLKNYKLTNIISNLTNINVDNKDDFIKASDTKKYYKNLNKENKK